jgi:FKBP-type peptidyl-prolyl cis-trans isomerase SlyD
MLICRDASVTMEYTVRLQDGSYVKGENGPVSLHFIAGYDEILPSLEARLLGLGESAETDFVIPASEAFGEHDPSQVSTRTFDEFPEGRNIQAGRWVLATNEETDAQYSYFVKEKTADAVVLDFNHPLAGRDLHYHVKVTGVRPALKEELEFLRPCEHGGETEKPSTAEGPRSS